MRIEELILEGFKSYPVRTTIQGWDPSFNAITGLNGSGKSNILDAICFVLGITNMSQMRAQNQQDLIYKRGQAGVTKASVTIVFDNSDPKTSPVGFDNCKQITVTRQIALPNVSKYLLNGHKTQQQTIQTLFQSVQLNINNPNFLIMQGKITKVLNMRPPEILALVEEAAGTRMFEERKERAERTILKKEKKVSEIRALLVEEITPKLDGLREEKKMWLKFQRSQAELERIGKVLRGWEYTEAQRRVRSKREDVRVIEASIQTDRASQDDLRAAIGEAEREVERIMKAREKEVKKGGKMQRLEKEVGELEKEMERVRTRVGLKAKTEEEEEKRKEKLRLELQSLEDGLEAKRAAAVKLEKAFTTIHEQHQSAELALQNGEDLLQSLLTGLGAHSSSSSGAGGGYMAQLADARQRIERAAAEEKQAKMRAEMTRKEMGEMTKRWKEVEREAGEGKKGVERMKSELDKLKAGLQKTGWNAQLEEESERVIGTARSEARKAREHRDAVRQRTGGLSFDYHLPHPSFDRSTVHGLVASLLTLPPEHADKAQALEQAAGGRLYNVVVADERVGKELLTNGKLKKRVTIIPLNKIEPRRLSREQIAAAQDLAPNRAWPAQSLLSYPPHVEKAIAFTFGNTFICADSAAAKAITFSKRVGVRSVTLDGDVYEPGGTLSGGAPPQGSGVLVRMQEMNIAEKEMGEAQKRLEELEGRGEGEKREKWRRMAKEVEMKEHELGLMLDQVEGSNAARVGADVEKLKMVLAEHEEAVESAKQKQKTAAAEASKLEKDMVEFKNNKEGKIDELKANIAKQKTALQKQSVVLKTHQKEVQTAKLELESAMGDIKEHQAKLEEVDNVIKALETELEQENAELEKQEASYVDLYAKLQEERRQLSHFDDELKALEGAIKEQKATIAEKELTITKLEHEALQLAKDQKAAQNQLEALEQQHEWIADEKDSFGKAGTPYDFESNKFNASELRKTAHSLESELKKNKKKVNPRVMGMIEGQEKQETMLKKNLHTVLKDKQKIEDTIEELDRYKRDALLKTWERVNELFGDIFADLLPGNFAKLQPPEGQDVVQGLEVKVRLGSVWKQSLTELSGGQRSLIALSLILSLLQFKPAPMYILDEVDAALDLSHTQHIGQLFRTRFKGSQFIVVSLKEGLFTNANVLFRTRFRDGTSIVERTANRTASNIYEGRR